MSAAIREPDVAQRFADMSANAVGDTPAETGTPAGDAMYKGKSAAEWSAQLHDKDGGKRAEAAVGLRALGPKARDAVPDLIRALKDKEPDVRSSAALALGKIGA